MTDRFPPHVLRDYALIADGERGALVGPRGDIVWMCAPQWHSDAVFAALIGGQGIYAITPASRFVWGGYYEDGTLIWRSRWITEGGIIECREALALPAAPHRAVVLRQVIARECPAHVDVALDPRAGFGQHGLRSLSRDDHGAWTGRAGELYLRWSGEVAEAKVHRASRPPRLTVSLTVPPGQSRDLVLELSRQPLPAQPPDPGTLWHTTHAQWAGEAPPLEGNIATRDARQAHMDAALLLPALRGATAADDPRTLQTLHAYLTELTQDGYGYRFRHDERPLGAAEGAFVLCGFLVSLALHQQGHEVGATRWFERNRAACGSPGLYSEEYDVAERQLRGNLPQAFVHALLLECAVRLGEPWDAR